MNWDLYLLAFLYTPLAVLLVGFVGVYIHGRYMDRVDAQEASGAGAKQPAE